MLYGINKISIKDLIYEKDVHSNRNFSRNLKNSKIPGRDKTS